MINGVFNYSFDFWVDYLFGTNFVATDSLFHIDGTLININITQIVFVNIMSIISIILILIIAYTLIRWFIKGVLSLI